MCNMKVFIALRGCTYCLIELKHLNHAQSIRSAENTLQFGKENNYDSWVRGPHFDSRRSSLL
jgi:hypothetical protein